MTRSLTDQPVDLTAEQFMQLRRSARLQRLGLAFREEWPLFSVTKKIADEAQQVWVILDEMQMPASDNQRAFLRYLLGELRRLEARLAREGLIGWLLGIRKGNWRMRRWTEMVGATLYATDEARWYFQKVAGQPPVPTSLKALIDSARRRMIHAHAATA